MKKVACLLFMLMLFAGTEILLMVYPLNATYASEIDECEHTFSHWRFIDFEDSIQTTIDGINTWEGYGGYHTRTCSKCGKVEAGYCDNQTVSDWSPNHTSWLPYTHRRDTRCSVCGYCVKWEDQQCFYSNYTSCGEGFHSANCDVCNQTVITKCSFVKDDGSDADITDIGAHCRDCGQVAGNYQPSSDECEHTFSHWRFIDFEDSIQTTIDGINTWEGYGGYHTRTCSKCGKVEAGYCDNQTVSDWSPNHTSWLPYTHRRDTRCSVCGYCVKWEDQQCFYESYESANEGFHASNCKVCGQLATIPCDMLLEIDEMVAATCTETGLTEGKHCSVCNKVLVAQEVIPALGHTEVTDEAKPATYTETGLTEGKHCSVCGEILVAQEVIPMLEYEPTQDGWASENGKWYYYQQGTAVTNDWVSDGDWYYFDASGIMATGWHSIGGTWYYFNSSGAMVTGWLQDGATWYYFKPSGAMATGWLQDGATWYYFNSSGAMATGWLQDSAWYYFKSSGAMVTGWLQDGATWYYFDTNGAMVTGTKVIDGTEYTFDASGAWIENTVSTQTGWVQDGGHWYYYDESGTKVTGWKNIGGNWYYFKNSGAMATGWFEDKEAENKLPANQRKALWYWFDNNGQMATGWKEINGQWEMFDSSGVWLYTWDGQ